MISVTDLPDGCVGVLVDPANFARWQSNQRVAAFPVVQDGLLSRTPRHLPPAAGNDFDVVDDRSQGDGPQRKSIPNFWRRCFTGYHFRANSQAVWRKDVRLLTISVIQEGDPGRPIWIVLDSFDRSLNVPDLSFEIDDSVLLFVPSSDVARRQTAMVVPTTCPLFWLKQRFLRPIFGYLIEARGLLKTLRRR